MSHWHVAALLAIMVLVLYRLMFTLIKPPLYMNVTNDVQHGVTYTPYATAI